MRIFLLRFIYFFFLFLNFPKEELFILLDRLIAVKSKKHKKTKKVFLNSFKQKQKQQQRSLNKRFNHSFT